MAIKRDTRYYQVARDALEGSLGHPGFIFLKNLCHSHKNRLVVDVGCGEGSRLDYLVNHNQGIGVDINQYAIDQARKKYPRFQFFTYDGDRLPIDNNKADVTYSTFVLEHTQDPKHFIDEMIRITKTGGYVTILCPNYGAPNRRSPNSIENPIKKLLRGAVDDFDTNKKLDWQKVSPKKEYRNIDDDTTVEPYVLSLIRFLKARGLKAIRSSSLWELETKTSSPRKLLFSTLGRSGLFPLKHWGPQVFVCFRK